MATRPTRPKGYLTKGKTKSPAAADKAAARKELKSLKGIASIIGRSVFEGVGGPKAKAAGAVIRSGKKALSGKALDAAINRANQSARSSKPVRNKGGGLRTTYSGPVRGKISNVAATRAAEKAAGPRARREGGNAVLRATKPKPGARIIKKTSGEVTRMGPGKKINLKLTQRAEGPTRPVKVKKTVTQGRIVRDIKSTDFVRPADRTRIVSGEAKPFFTKEKWVTTSRGVKRETNKKGSAITVRKVEPRKAKDVKDERDRIKRDKLRDALTPRVNPARSKPTPKRASTGTTRNDAREKEIIDRYYRIRFRDRGGPNARSAQDPQSSIESRIAAGVEKPTRGNVNTLGDKEASDLAQRSMRDVERPSLKIGADFKPKKSASRVKPGVRTNTTRLIREIKKSTNPADKKAKTAELKRVIRNQRRVLKEREIKEAAERIRKAEEAAKIREAAAKRRSNGLLKGRVIKK